MKETCTSVSTLLEKFFDREVTEDERALVEGHLQECHDCQQALKLMEDLRFAIKAPVEEAVSSEHFPWMWERIQKEMRSQERWAWHKTIRAWIFPSSFFRKRIWVPATVAAAIALLIASHFFFQKTPSSGGFSVVEYVESQTHNVMIYQLDQGRMTVIWLLEGPDQEQSTS